jgi:hypothetical protein
MYCMSHINLSETNGRHARSTVVNLDSNRATVDATWHTEFSYFPKLILLALLALPLLPAALDAGSGLPCHALPLATGRAPASSSLLPAEGPQLAKPPAEADDRGRR